MYVRWDGELAYKAYHDPETDRVDIVSSGVGGEGEMLTLGEGEPSMGFLCEPDGFCSLIELERALAGSRDDLEWSRPDECAVATDAEVEVVAEGTTTWHFDAPTGTLRIRFEAVEPVQWARLGANLLWLAIDAEARLAALVFEGVSRDPGGKAQAVWLSEMNAG